MKGIVELIIEALAELEHIDNINNKYERKRKIKKVNRLTKRAERKGVDIDKQFRRDPIYRKLDMDNGNVKIVVDSPDCEISIQTDCIIVTTADQKFTETINKDYTSLEVEKTNKYSITTFEIILN